MKNKKCALLLGMQVDVIVESGVYKGARQTQFSKTGEVGGKTKFVRT